MPLDRPIPAFYCCYLLRSTIRHGNVYVGSTPNPGETSSRATPTLTHARTVRRLGQHNGLAKGGAARTNRPSLRPWEMACIVAGFPSHIAALQFEWAWQNPHITLHIPAESRLQHAAGKKKSGHPKRPRHSVASLLSNLHLLLRSPSFSRWPLDIRFFSEDVHKAWLKSTKSIDETLRDSIPIIEDYPPKSTVGNESGGSPKLKRRKMSQGIGALDVDYAQLKSHVEKGKEMMEFEREGQCAVCHLDLEHDAGIYAVCPSAGCESVTHLTCLSKHFLQGEGDSLVPIKGNCPSCKAELRWVDVVKELTLRTRGQKEVERLLKAKRAKKRKIVASSESVIESSDSDELSDEEIEMEIGEEIKRLQEFDPTGRNMDMGDSWHVVDDLDSDTGSITSTTSQTLMPPSYKAKPGGLGTVIEDSDWDDAEIVD